MRLHTLTLSAFGPYPGSETVDFDLLGADGLFLLHGDTGAGKTTVLDGVAFALFGTVPGARAEARRLRCDYAAADARTEVALEFTVQGRRLRITRSPEYQRPKRRGEGFTAEPAKVNLVWLTASPADAEPAVAAPEGLTRADEVGRTVQRLLGMSAEQFFQVVLLPQGEFARFLRAETAEREQLLEKLFGTQRFAEIERWFRDHRLVRQRELADQRRGVDALLARVGQAAAADPPADLEIAGTRVWLDELCGRLAEDSRAATAEDTAARAVVRAAEDELGRLRTDADRIRRVRHAAAELAAFEAEQADRERWAAEISEARRAAGVVAAERGRSRAVADQERAVAAEAATLARVDPADAAWASETAVLALRQRVGEMRGQVGGLDELVAEASRQDADLRRLDTLAKGQQQTEDQLAQLARQLAEAPGRIQSAREALGAAQDAAARVEGVAAQLAELDRIAADADAIPAAAQAVVDAADAVRHATDKHQASRERLLDLRQRRLIGMAAELAVGLRAGVPCAVCGALEHPAPASAVDPVTDADERAAAEAEERAHHARDVAQDRFRDASAAHEALRARVAGHPLDELAADRERVAERYRALAACAATIDELTVQLASLEGQVEELRGQRTELDRRQSAAGAEHAELADRVAARAARLDAARDGHADVASRRAHLLRLAETLEQLANHRAERRAAEAHCAEQADAVAKLAMDAGFAGPDEALAAARAEDALSALADQLARSEHRGAVARAVLAEPELAALRDAPEIDLAPAERRAVEARKHAEHAIVAAKAAEARAAEVGALSGRLAAAWAELEPTEAEFDELAALTDVVNGRGQNSRKMSLRSYVLAARLQEVAAAATWRLRRMSQGRYTFVHSDAAGPRGTRGGLGLDIRDDYSGRVRPTKTLSGGESFLASLSLALGLADVVAAETGGALLDTLFVDEGFGTLDSDTLDVVMDTLDELRAGGRVVGLVSHVEELRQRIPVRLRVRKARSGSTLELTAG